MNDRIGRVVIPLDAASEAGPDGSRLAYGREPPLSASRRVFLDRIFASVGAFRRRAMAAVISTSVTRTMYRK